MLLEKTTIWTYKLSYGKLPAKWAWVSYFHQLWAKICFGLGVNASPVGDLVGQEAEGGPLRKAYRRMLPYLGVNRNIKAGWRHLPSTFGGIGLRKLLSEVVIARLNLFLQHYNISLPWGQSSQSLSNAYNSKSDPTNALCSSLSNISILWPHPAGANCFGKDWIITIMTFT